METNVEEINLQIAQIEKKIQILKKARSQNQVNANSRFEEMEKLLLELVALENLYYNYRTLLGFAYPNELDEEERTKIEMLMPILEEKIKTTREKLE